MLKLFGFLLCAVSLVLFTSGYNRQQRRRLDAYSAALSVLKHVREKMLVFPDTLEEMLADFEPACDREAELARAVAGGANRGSSVGQDLSCISDSIDEDDLGEFFAFISEFGGGYLDSERKRCEKITEHFDARHTEVAAQVKESKRLCSVLLACAVGGLLMLVI